MKIVRFLSLFLVWFVIGAAVRPLGAASPRRVVSMSPNLTESAFAIGAGDLLVGVGDFCKYPPAAQALRRCGSQTSPNYETLSALRPDLILVLGKSPKVREFAASRGIAVESFTMDSLAAIKSELLRMGVLLGREQGTTSLTRAMDAQLAALQADLADHPAASRPSVLVCLGRQPGALSGILVPAGGSFLDEALTLAGGRNVFGDIRQFYPQISKESLLVRRPEVIIELTGGSLPEAQRRRLIDDWKNLPSLPAVRSGRIHVLTQDFLMTPGPRQPAIVRAFHEALFPPPPHNK